MLKAELDRIRERISDPNFLENKGLSNEVGIHVFCYDPADELVVQDYIRRIKEESGTPYRIIECDLYEIFLQVLEEKRVLKSTPGLETKRGKDYLLQQLQKIATPEALLAKMDYAPHVKGQDVLFMTGIGKIHPFMRSHKMLDSMQHLFADIPVVMFYPGTFNGQTLSLFDEFVDGNYSSEWIAQELSENGPAPLHGGQKWHQQTIRKILTNEKYIGDALCQKTYTTNTFPYRRKDNHGEADQYYVEHTHPAIISYEDFQKVQELLKRRAERQSIPHDQTPLARKIICGQCGTLYMRRISKAGYVSWVCRKHDRKAADCPNGRISEDSIHAAFLRMYRKLRTHDGIVLSPVLRQMDTLSDALHRGNPAMLAVNTAIATASEQSYHLTKLHTAGLLDKAALSAKQAELNAKLTELRRERRKLLCNEDIDEQVDAIRLTIDTIRNGPETLSSFDEILFTKLVERIVVDTQSTIRFQLYGGFEFQETLEA